MGSKLLKGRMDILGDRCLGCSRFKNTLEGILNGFFRLGRNENCRKETTLGNHILFLKMNFFFAARSNLTWRVTWALIKIKFFLMILALENVYSGAIEPT
eukprot:GHVP01052932.1.p1 GENE.GHVP01052932.1~~GHVP01052932.1.p1  ORF type:complete len:100 (-),score=11.38 GHVP01052932.1:45-344(-)